MKRFLALLLCVSAVVYSQTREVPNLGSSANDGTGDSLRSFGIKVANNESNLFKMLLTNGPAARVVDSVADLVAFTGFDGVQVVTLGYHAPGDGGGAVYRWASGYSGATNALGGALAVSGGAWVQLGDEINVKQFGAVGDGATDDTDALQAMLEWSEGRHAIIPDGTYYTTKASLEALPYYGLSFRNNSTVEWRGGMVTLETNVAVRHIFCARSPGASLTNVTILNPQIDAQNSKGNLLGFAWGGDESTSVRDIKIIGGTLLNAKHDPELNGLGGGRAITFQFGVRDCIVQGVTVRGCHTAFDVHGDDGSSGREVRRVVFANCAVYDCEFVGTVLGLADPSEPTDNEGRNILSVVFTGIAFENCGLSIQDSIGNLAFERVNNAGNGDPFVDYYQAATTYLLNWEIEPYSAAFAEWDPSASYSIGDKVKITDNGRFGAVFGILTGTGVLIEGIRGFNSDDYGTVGAFVRGDGSNIHVADCQLGINVESLIWLGHNRNIWPIHTRYYSRPSNWVVNNLSNTGTNEVVVKATLPVDIAGQAPLSLPLSPRQIWMGGLKLYPDGMTQIVDDSLEVTASQNLQDWMTWMEVWNWKSGGRISGSFGNIYENANALTDVNSTDRYGFKDVRARPIHIETYQSNNQLRLQRNGSSSGTANIWVNNGILNSDVPLSLQTSGATIRAGAGSPIGAVSAAVGSIYQQSDVTDGASIWAKQSGGTGNTGWKLLSGDTVVTVDSVADLVALSTTTIPAVQTLGYYAPGDGGGAVYRWTSGYSGATNALGGALAVSGGAWVQIGDEINVRQFGARGDGATDDFASLQAAADWIGAGMAGTLFFPPGTYVLDELDNFIPKGPGRYYGSGATIKLASPAASGAVVHMYEASSRIIWDGINIDANNISGQNGIGVTLDARDINISNLSVSNCVHSTSIGGGRGITLQHSATVLDGGGARRIVVDSVSVFNSYSAFDVSGRFAPGETFEDQGTDGIRIANCYAYNCEQLIQSFARNTISYPQDPKYLAAVVVNLQGYNVGYPRTYSTNRVVEMSSYTASTVTTSAIHFLAFGDPVRFGTAFGNVDTNTTYYVRNTPSSTTFTISTTDAASGAEFDIGASGSLTADVNVQWFIGGAIVFDRGGNLIMSNVQIYNDDTYPRLPSVVRGKASGLVIDNLSVYADVQNVIDARSFSETSGNWSAQAQGFRDSVVTIKVFGDVGTIVTAEDGGSAKMTDCKFDVTVDSVRWGILDKQAGLKGDSYISAYQRPTLKRRSGGLANVYTYWNDFSGEQSDATWTGSSSVMRFDVIRTANTNTAIGTIYNGGLLQLRAQANTLQTLGDGLVNFNAGAWNGNGLVSIFDNRLWHDGGVLMTKLGGNPSSASDGVPVAARMLIQERAFDTTWQNGTSSSVQSYVLTGDSTVTMSTTNAVRGLMASFVRRGAEPYTLNVGPGIKTIPAGMPATVDLIYDGTNWVTLRYTEHVSQPLTVELTESGGNVTISGGGRRTYSHSLNAITGGDSNLVFTNIVDGDTGTLLVWAASTNVTLTLTDAFAYSPSGSTLTVTGGANNWSVIAWEARTINATNVVLVNLGDYSR